MTDFKIVIETCLDDAAHLWAGLPHDFVGAPYQSLQWCQAYVSTLGKDRQTLFKIAALQKDNQTLAVLPFELIRKHGAKVVQFIGSDKGNQNTGLWSPTFYQALTEADGTHILKILAQGAGSDLINLINVPTIWLDRRHPLVLPASPTSPSPVFRAPLSRPFDAFISASLSKSSRKKLIRKRRSLVEAGNYRAYKAETPRETETILSAFFAQRTSRAKLSGIPNAFSGSSDQDFLREICSPYHNATASHRIEAQIWGLEVAGKTRATFLCFKDKDSLYGYATSFAQDELLAYSPGTVLWMEIVQAACEDEGLSYLDLGLGDERYKHGWTLPVDLSDSIFASTPKGKLLASAFKVKTHFKGAIRNSDKLWPLVRKLREIKARSSS